MKLLAKIASVGNVGNVCFLQILRSALHVGGSVGNVGNTFRFPTFLRPRCADVFGVAR